MKRFLAATLALTLMAGTVSTQAHDRDHDRGRHSHRDHHDRQRDYHASARHWHEHRWDERRDDHREWVQHGARYRVGNYYRPVGYREYAWHRGARLPAAYCVPRYIVNDYRAYDLYRPPHGHHWVRVNHDVVLAAVASGAVVAVVNNLFY